MLHLLIVLLFIAILIALFSSLWSLLRSPSADGTTANRLMWRVIFSALLILLLIIGFSSGQLRPHAPWHGSEHIHKQEQSYPDYVHEVPIPGHGLKTEVLT